jgi:hypothetical protein
MKHPITIWFALLVTFMGQLSFGQGIYIQQGASVSVVGGGILLTTGGAAGQLTIRTNASGSGSLLVDNNASSAVALSGNANIERYLPTESWHFISSPISDGLSGIFLDDYLITSDPTSATGWGPYIVPVNIPLEVMRGYAVWKPATNPSFETFSGTLNNGNLSISITRNPADPWAGWHMAGNSYPCAIDLASSGITWNQVEPTAYFWNPASGNYYSYPHLSSPPPNVGGDHSQYVPSMQGFYVHISDAFTGTTSLDINNSARLHSGEPFLKEAAQNDGFLVLKAQGTQNTYYDKAIIHFNPSATADFDGGYDGYKLFGEEDAPQFYSNMNGTLLSYNALPYAGVTTVIPMGFSSGFSDAFTISAGNTQSFSSLSHIYLEDKKESILQDLLLNPVYSFSYSAGEDADRFQLRFQNPSLSIGDKAELSSMHVWASGNTVFVQNDANLTRPEQLFIYDMLGRDRFHSELTLNPLDKVRTGLPSGYYVVKVISDDQLMTRKVFIGE